MPSIANTMSTLIVLGGPPGAGKTSLSKRLSIELSIPRLSSDSIGRTIRLSQGIQDGAVNATWIAFDVVFNLCAEFLEAGVSTVLDLNMGWAFQWQQLDAIRNHQPGVRWLPIILRCPRERCITRIRHRYDTEPTTSAPPELYDGPRFVNVWTFLEQLDRPDVYSVDAARPEDHVYADVKRHLRQQKVIR